MKTPFLPYREYTYHSSLPAEAILERIANDLEPRKWIRWHLFETNKKPFEGTVQGHSFDIQRIIRYRNSFLPQITGQVEDRISHREVQIQMRMHRLVEFVLITWVGIFALIVAGVTFTRFASGKFEPWILVVIPFLLFAYLLSMGGFLYEVKKAHQYFSEWLEEQV